jgi:hypothetical protein
LLRVLISTAENHDYGVVLSVNSIVDAVSWTEVDFQFIHPFADRFGDAEIAILLNAPESLLNNTAPLSVPKAAKPFQSGCAAIRRNVVLN